MHMTQDLRVVVDVLRYTSHSFHVCGMVCNKAVLMNESSATSELPEQQRPTTPHPLGLPQCLTENIALASSTPNLPHLDLTQSLPAIFLSFFIFTT